MLNRNSNSPLSLFIMLSVGLHIIGASLFVIFVPKIKPVQSVEIILQTSDNVGSKIATARQTTQKIAPVKEIQKEVPIPTPTAPVKSTPVAPKPIAQAPVQTAQPVAQQTVPVAQAKPMQRPIGQMPITPKPVTQPVPVAQVPVQKPVQPVAQKPVQQPQTQPTQQAVQQQVVQPVVVQTNKVVAQQPSTNTSNTVITNSNKDLSQELDQLLAQKTTSTTKSTDELADATWSGAPRKTLAFPNIVASIPGEYKARGLGFSVTAKITFSQQGWVSSVELTQGSGDPRIDGIFRTELRKIRVEPIQVSRNDTITKTFKVSVK